MYGDSTHDFLVRLTRSTVNLGSLAVDGFFLLSGFLIVKSWHQKPILSDYLQKRILRIVPGYYVAVALSVLVAGWVAPGIPNYFKHLGLPLVKSTLVLAVPDVPPVFPTAQFYHTLNDSLWTIAYEFRCYILTALLGMLGILRKNFLWLMLTVFFLVLFLQGQKVEHFQWPHFSSIFGYIGSDVRFFSVFFVGGCFYLFKDRIRFHPVAALAFLACLVLFTWRFPAQFEFFLVVFGSYLLFYFTNLGERGFAWMHSVPDISYGVYLYGWPVQMFWIVFWGRSPFAVFVASTLVCYVLGWLSWHYVERPALILKRNSTVPLPAA